MWFSRKVRLSSTFRPCPDFWLDRQGAVDLDDAAGHGSNLPVPLLKSSW
jgi:hypothetical protein